jgi:hypothetical protein
MTNDLATWAVKYAKRGFRVFPLYGITKGKCDCKKECNSPGKHPYSPFSPHGEKNATDDINKIQKWWKKYPNANIGLVVDGVLIIDVDGKRGKQSLEKLGRIPNTATVKTGRGKHFYFKDRKHD